MRDETIDVLKGIGIILVVIGHSGCPEQLINIIYMFHMPLFFIASGYLLNPQKLINVKSCAKRKIESLYFPFIKYSLLFLILHNFFLEIGIINIQNGAEYYNLTTIIKELCLRVFFIEIHTEQLLGTYWFIQSLFFGYIFLSLIYSLGFRFTANERHSEYTATCLFLLGALLISIFHSYFPDFRTICLYRISAGTSMLLIGYYLRKKCFINKIYSFKRVVLLTIIFTLLYFIHPSSLKEQSSLLDFISGPIGFILVFIVSDIVNKHNMCVSRILSYLGRNSFYIMTFHFLCFKPVSILITEIYHLDYLAIGLHPSIKMNGTLWWIAYTIISIILSVLFSILINRYGITLKIVWRK